MLHEKEVENINTPEYLFTTPGTILFIAGTPLSGKTTIAPLLTSNIKGATLQNMDIVRLLEQDIEKQKPEKNQNKFVFYGSCDAYELIGDGTYNKNSLIKGFNIYSQAVSAALDTIIPQLEAQGAKEVVFEGVQLTPSLVKKYLKNNNKLIVITSSTEKLSSNLTGLFTEDELLERYSVDKLLLIQEEILKQCKFLETNSYFIVDNSGDYLETVKKIFQFLKTQNVIKS